MGLFMHAIQNVREAIRDFIHAQFPAARKRGVGDQDSLLEQGIVDSMGVLEIVTFLEHTFSLTLSDDEMIADHFESITRIADLVQLKLTQQGSAWTS